MAKRNFLKDEDGFTLIEIIAVLVILGILAAVAVPKFFDLQDKAKLKAVDSAVAELKSRVNQRFATELLDGKPNPSYLETQVGVDLGSEFAVSSWTVNGTTNITFTVTFHPGQNDEQAFTNRSISLPKLGG